MSSTTTINTRKKSITNTNNKKMKKALLIAGLFTAAICTAQADTSKKMLSPKYVEAMTKNIAIADTAFTLPSLQQAYNGFERVSGAEKSEWLPAYYMAYCLVMESYLDKGKNADDYCDKAWKLLDRADSISPNNAEIYALRAMCVSARIRVNPMSRGAKYGRESSEWLDKAQLLDASNPRIYLLRGEGVYYTPSAFGGGKENAKPVFEEAIKKYNTFVPATSLHPHWGKTRAQMMLDDCNKK
jgi:hypothetical protein